MESLHSKNRVVKSLAIFVILMMMVSLVSCGFGSDMPFNGDIVFHDMTMTIPEKFIRDSTQSSDDLWVFEQGQYSEYIILTRNDITGDTSASLDSYVEYMKEQGADSERTTFMDMDAVLSTYTLEEKFCQEMLFAYNGSFYAVALRGGTAEDFDALLATVGTADIE